LGKAAKLVQSARGMQAARLITDPGGGICSWISSTKALRHTGQKVFASVDDLAQAVNGQPLSKLGGVTLESMVGHLRSIGAAVGEVRPLSTVQQVEKMLPRDGSVVLISVNCMKNGARAGGHAFYAFYDKLGRLRFMDRTGIYSSIEELASRYKQFDAFALRAGATLKNVFLKFVGPKGTATLAMEANVLLVPDEPAAVQPPVAPPQPGKPQTTYSVKPGDSLSKIAGQFYKDIQLWALLWDANRAAVGPNPNRITPGQQLTIPDLSGYSAVQLAGFRQRSSSWRGYR
jgi:LysM repeat protein